MTVHNFDAWCTVTVGSGAASPAAEQTVCAMTGTSVQVSAYANAGFMLGTTPWHGTFNDTGTGEQGSLSDAGANVTSSATVKTMGATQCAYVCCPFTNGTGCSGAGFTAPCP